MEKIYYLCFVEIYLKDGNNIPILNQVKGLY